MNPLSKVKHFVLNKNEEYTCRDFTYTNFSDIAFPADMAISFFRSDFRGSRFENIIFQKNCFDRADFISCTFAKCKFIDVDFGACEMKTCYFIGVEFENCIFNNTSIQESTFEKCTFNKQHILVNMKNCHMINTRICNCSFERSTTENIIFEHCLLKNTDFATMHAECHRFIDCDLTGVKLGISYVFGYLLCGTNIEDFEVLYRGKRVNLNSQEEALKFLEESRMYEIINLLFIYQKFNKVPSILEKTLHLLYHKYTPASKSEIVNIFEAILFYAMYDIMPYKCFIECIAIINNFQLPKLSLKDELLFISYKEKMNYFITNSKYGVKFIESSQTEKAIIRIHVNTNDYNQALEISETFLDELCKKCGFEASYELVESQKGSWLLTFAISAVVIISLPKVVKNYYSIISEIQIKKGFKKQILKKLEKKHLSINEINDLADVVSKLDITSQVDISVPEQISSIKAFL